MPLTETSIQLQGPSPLLPARGSDVRPVIRQSIGDCGVEVPHVFDTTVLPPNPDKRCRCGKQTWKKAEAEMLELRLKTFPAAQLLTSPFPTAQPRTSPSETEGGPKEKSAALRRRDNQTTGDVIRHPNAAGEQRPPPKN